MDTKIACSACRSIFVAGPKFCPNCGLPLTAQAIPVVRQRKSIWPVILGVFGAMIAIMWIGSTISDNSAREQQAKLKAALANGGINTPAAFQARCGHASSAKPYKSIPALEYVEAAGTVTVTFSTAPNPAFYWTRELAGDAKPDIITSAVDNDFAMSELSCK